MKKANDPRSQRTTHEKLKALDNELFLLRDHCERVADSPSHIGALATVLRTLVCTSSQRLVGLLWRMTEDLNIDDFVTIATDDDRLKGFPVAKRNVGNVIPSFFLGSSLPPGFSTIQRSLKDFITGQLVIMALSKDLTFETLIKIVAQQIGTAHQADWIDPELRQFEGIMINGTPSFVQPLITIARLVIEVGERVLRSAASKKTFTRIKHKGGDGDFSFAVVANRRKSLLKPVPILSVRSLFFDISFDYSVDRSGMSIKIISDGILRREIHAPYICDSTGAELVYHILSYSSLNQKIRAMQWDDVSGVLISDATEQCYIGWLHGSDFEGMLFDEAAEVLVSVVLTKGITSVKELKLLFDPIGNGIIVDSEAANFDEDEVFPGGG